MQKAEKEKIIKNSSLTDGRGKRKPGLLGEGNMPRAKTAAEDAAASVSNEYDA